MSVQTEIGRIAQAKTDIKNVVNSKVANTITNQTIDAFPPLINSSIAAYKNLIPWIEGSGSSFTIDNAEAGKIDKFEMYGNTEQGVTLSILPDGYTQVEYIQGTGTQWIDTGRKMYNNSELEFCFSFDVIPENCSIFGSRHSGTANNFEIASSLPIFLLYSDYGNYNIGRATYNSAVINTKYICTISKSLRAFYDENRTLLARNTNLISEDNVTPSNARIFDTAGGYSANKLKGKVYYCKIWENGVLVRNMIPCTNPSNVAGMYDTVNDVFYSNAGTGTFNVGPDNPQDIRVVTGNNSVNVIGKNLFDKTITKSLGDGRIRETILETGKKLKWNSVSTTTDYIWLCYVIKDISNYVGKTVRFKTNFSASASNTPQYTIGICDSDGNNRTSKANSTTSGNTISFTIPSLSGTQTYLYVLLYANSGGTLNSNDYVDFTNMILTIDNEDMTYIPYQSQTYPINLGTIELCKIGDYQDYIYKDNGKWYKHSEIGKVVLNGSEENLSYSSTANRLQMPFNLQTQNWGALALTLCDHFTRGDTETVDGSFNITRTTLFFKNNNLTSLNDWKTWLGSNNTTVYYVLATSTDEEKTDTTLISQLNAIETYTGTNTFSVSNSNGVLPDLYVLTEKQNSYKN